MRSFKEITMSIEKRIADFMMGAFGKAREVEQTVETAVIAEVKKIDNIKINPTKIISNWSGADCDVPYSEEQEQFLLTSTN